MANGGMDPAVVAGVISGFGGSAMGAILTQALSSRAERRQRHQLEIQALESRLVATEGICIRLTQALADVEKMITRQEGWTP